MVKRRSDEDHIALGGAAGVRQDTAAPILPVVCQQHTLWQTCRARGVGLDGHGIWSGLEGLKRTKIQKTLKTIRTSAEEDNVDAIRNKAFQFRLGEDKAYRSIAEDVGNRIGGKLDIDRNRDDTRAHRPQ